MKNETIDYLLMAQETAEKFGVLPKNSEATRSITSKLTGLFRSDVSVASVDITTSKKHANEVIAALTKLLLYFPTLNADIDIFKKLIIDNSESWQYTEAVRATSLKILLLKNEKVNNHDEYDGFPVDACLDSLAKLRMDNNEQDAVATISLADKMIDFLEKNVAKNDALLIAVKATIAEAKRLLAEGRDDYEDLESEAPDDVFKLATDEAKFVINTINNFYNPQNLENDQSIILPRIDPNNRIFIKPAGVKPDSEVTKAPALEAEIDMPIIASPPGLENISKATVKVPPGLGDGSPPVAPEIPSFLKTTTDTRRASPPPPPPPVPPSRDPSIALDKRQWGAPPSEPPPSHSMPTYEREPSSSDSSTSSSGMDGKLPPPIPGAEFNNNDAIERATTSSISDEENLDESNESRDSAAPSIDSYSGIEGEELHEEDARSMPDLKSDDEDEVQEEIIVNSGESIALDPEVSESIEFAKYYLHELGLNFESFTPQEKRQLGDDVQEFVNACEMYFAEQSSKSEYVRLTFDDVMKNSIVKDIDKELAAAQLLNVARECINQNRENQITESQMAAVINNPVIPVSDEFWNRPDDMPSHANSAASEPPPVPPSRQVQVNETTQQVDGNKYDNLAELFGMIGHHLESLNIDERHINALKDNPGLKYNLILFVHAFNDYFSKENYTLEGAQDLMRHFDDVLLDVNNIIDEHGYQFYGDVRDGDEKYQDSIRKTIKNSVAEELVTFAANINKLENSNDISVTAIREAISVQRKALAKSILSEYEPKESGAGGLCGDRSIIQAVRAAIRGGAIITRENHKLHDILQPRDPVGAEKMVNNKDAAIFRKWYEEQLQLSGVEQIHDDEEVVNEDGVRWLGQKDLVIIADLLKVNIRVVQKTESGEIITLPLFKPEAVEGVVDITLFNDKNQHYQALLPKSRTEIQDDYVHVELEVVTTSKDDEILAQEFDSTQFDSTLLDAKVPGKLNAALLAAIAPVVGSQTPREQQESPALEQSHEAVTNRPVNPLNAELNKSKRFQEQRRQQEQQRQQDALFGSSPKQRNDDLTNVTPVEGESAAGLRNRKNPAMNPGFVAKGRHLINEELMQQNSSEEAVTEERAPVITTEPSSRTTSSRVVESAISSTAAELIVDGVPRPEPQILLVEMMRKMIDERGEHIGIGYVDAEPGALNLYDAQDKSKNPKCKVMNPQYGDTKGGIGKFVAMGTSTNDTYNVTRNALISIKNLSSDKMLYPISVRNITTTEQVIGFTQALFEYCKKTTGSEITATQLSALKDIFIDGANSANFKDVLYKFLQDIPEIYTDDEDMQHDDHNYKSFVRALRDTAPQPPIVITTAAKLGIRPPIVQREIVYQPICGILHPSIYTPKDTSLMGRFKRKLIGDGRDNTPKNPRLT